MEFSEQIKAVRLKLHMSQTEFAQLLGVSFTTINRYENGKSNPSYRVLRAFEQLCKDKNISLGH
ncbi:MAG: helix-turn-helix domain-containing protein [Bacteroides sp.]|nr:helix-turn-helix domain-containing protein [Bacteroides sp.]